MAGLSPSDFALAATAPLFAGLSPADLGLLIEGAQTFAYDNDTVLFDQGDPADRFFIILEGRVELIARTETGGHSIIEAFDAINTFAEAAIFSSGRFPLSCEVAAGSRLVHVPASSFLRHLAERPRLAMALLAGLADWQARMVREIAEIKGKSPVQRLASFLLSLAEGSEGAASLRLPLSKSALASRIGITPESLSRALTRLKAVGVESSGRQVEIADLAVLARISREGE